VAIAGARKKCREELCVVPSSTILVAAPDDAFRRSLVFALESDGFIVSAHAGATEAFASLGARDAACAVIDDDAVADWILISRQFDSFGRPVILLTEFRRIPALPSVRLLMKPFLGEPLVKAVRDAVTNIL
jgi:FixJ family two-component response regulator